MRVSNAGLADLGQGRAACDSISVWPVSEKAGAHAPASGTSCARRLRARRLRGRAGLFHEVGAQRLAPVRDGGDLLLLEQDLGLLLHVGLEIGREAGIDLDGGERLA